MKIEIWNEEQKEEEPPVRLRLTPTSFGGVLKAVSKKGVGRCMGNLISITKGGSLKIHKDVLDRLGISMEVI